MIIIIDYYYLLDTQRRSQTNLKSEGEMSIIQFSKLITL